MLHENVALVNEHIDCARHKLRSSTYLNDFHRVAPLWKHCKSLLFNTRDLLDSASRRHTQSLVWELLIIVWNLVSYPVCRRWRRLWVLGHQLFRLDGSRAHIHISLLLNIDWHKVVVHWHGGQRFVEYPRVRKRVIGRNQGHCLLGGVRVAALVKSVGDVVVGDQDYCAHCTADFLQPAWSSRHEVFH